MSRIEHQRATIRLLAMSIEAIDANSLVRRRFTGRNLVSSATQV